MQWCLCSSFCCIPYFGHWRSPQGIGTFVLLTYSNSQQPPWIYSDLCQLDHRCKSELISDGGLGPGQGSEFLVSCHCQPPTCQTPTRPGPPTSHPITAPFHTVHPIPPPTSLQLPCTHLPALAGVQQLLSHRPGYSPLAMATWASTLPSGLLRWP